MLQSSTTESHYLEWLARPEVKMDVLNSKRICEETYGEKPKISVCEADRLELYVYSYTYGLLTDVLRRSRDKARCQLFEGVRFALCSDCAMTSWISEEPSKWLFFTHDGHETRDRSSICNTLTGSDGETDKYNKQLWESF